MLVAAEFEAHAEIRDQLMTLLLAGHETTATGLAWTFDLLIRHPAVLERLVAEVDAGEQAYLRAVVTESLRLRPVVPLAGRRLTRRSASTATSCRPEPTSRRRSGSRTRAATAIRSRSRSVPSASSTARPRPPPGSRSAAACGAASAPRSRRWRCGSRSRRSCGAGPCGPRPGAPSASLAGTSRSRRPAAPGWSPRRDIHRASRASLARLSVRNGRPAMSMLCLVRRQGGGAAGPRGSSARIAVAVTALVAALMAAPAARADDRAHDPVVRRARHQLGAAGAADRQRRHGRHDLRRRRHRARAVQREDAVDRRSRLRAGLQRSATGSTPRPNAIEDVQRTLEEQLQMDPPEVAQALGQPKRGFGAYQTFGDVALQIANEPGAVQELPARAGHRRTRSPACRTRSGGVRYTREYFASRPDGAIVMRLSADQPGKVGFTASVTVPDNRSKTVTARDGRITVAGALNDNGLRYESQLQVTSRRREPHRRRRRVGHRRRRRLRRARARRGHRTTPTATPTTAGADPHRRRHARPSTAPPRKRYATAARKAHERDSRRSCSAGSASTSARQMPDVPTDELLRELPRRRLGGRPRAGGPVLPVRALPADRVLARRARCPPTSRASGTSRRARRGAPTTTSTSTCR